jgi:hypothetical protein
MSFFYAQNNDESTKDLFQKRLIYKLTVKELGHKHIVNFHRGERFMYGRVNRLNVPIVLISPNPLGGLSSYDADLCRQQNFYGTAFVVDAFHDLVKHYRYSTFDGKIASGDEFLSELQIYKAFENPNALYDNQVVSYGSALQKIFRQSQLDVTNFSEFIEHFMATLENTAHRTPFTKAAFVKSRYCPMTCSGLAIEIADLDPTNDEEKITKFIESPNWPYFVNLCNQYGFMIDQFVPWRIVADIDSEGMRQYANRYGANTTNKILNSMYKPVYYQNYAAFKSILLNIYDQVKRPVYPQEGCSTTIEGAFTPDPIEPVAYTLEKLSAGYSEEYFLKLYCKIRFLEEESQFALHEQNILLNDCQDIAISEGPDRALDYFERIINKPFDYRGSLSYIKKQILAQVAEDRRTQGIPVSSTDDISGY